MHRCPSLPRGRPLHAMPTHTHRACRRAQQAGGALPAVGTPLYSDMSEPITHGTHVSGIAAGVGNNGVGIAGMNWAVALHVCKAADATGTLPSSSLLECYRVCGQIAGVRVVSASYSEWLFPAWSSAHARLAELAEPVPRACGAAARRPYWQPSMP